MGAKVGDAEQSPRWSMLWAKTGRGEDDGRFHPLLFHMLDVAAVAGLVWDHCLTPKVRKRLELAFGVAEARILFVFLAGAHDIGKACPGFQKKATRLSGCLDLPFSGNDRSYPHGFITASVLKDIMGTSPTAILLGQVAGGHHGIFPRSSDLRMGRDTLGSNDWNAARQGLMDEFAAIVGFDRSRLPFSKINDPSAVPVLAGFISAVDWIGSNQAYFSCATKFGEVVRPTPSDYGSKAQEQAQRALSEIGWLPSVTFAEESRFESVFPGFVANDLQETAIELASKQSSPYLMIVEAPMGHGKTEAALYAADLALCRGFARGMYIAMPTQATGNAMFTRVLEGYLKRRGHRGKLNLQLVHGNARLASPMEVREGEIPFYKPESIGDEGADVEAQSWFTAKKRPLLAPFGVGTIDQSLLSVIQTKHWFVRLFGLMGKVVIFDEVHAYDAYTSTLLERLLCWLAEIDCTVIILSATLPEDKRRSLVKAYSGRDLTGRHHRYPRITLGSPRRYPDDRSRKRAVCREVPMGESRTVRLEFANPDVQSLGALLADRLRNGGCAAVICSTVDRSIEVFRHLQGSLQDTECSLFHARTLQMWRREREEEVLRKFGKGAKQSDGMFLNTHRPRRSVLVATQVIEQSLDLDFDLMVSEMAPVDLLLQRLGRLHRHVRARPQGLELPRLVVLCDAKASGQPPESFGKSIEWVYDRYVLLRTWLVLRGRDKIVIPEEIEEMIESVYGSEEAPCGDGWSEALSSARNLMESQREESEQAAGRLLVTAPEDPADLIEHFNDQLTDDDNPEVHKTMRAATREGDPSVTVVMLHHGETLPAATGIPEIRKLLDRSVKISHRGIFHALLHNGESPAFWASSAHLSHARLLRLDEWDQARIKNWLVTVDERLGIVIKKQDEADA